MIDPNTRTFVDHVANLFDVGELDGIRADFNRIRNARLEARSLSDRERAAVRRGESADAVRKRERWYDIWKHPTSMEGLLETLRPFTYVTFPVQVRHVTQAGHYVPWHQDRGYIELLGSRGPAQVITCFLPLEPNPADCTTIEFALDNQGQTPERLYPHTSMDGFGAGIAGLEFAKRKHFDLALGDALIFGDLALHRTFTPAGAQTERRSLEFRLIQPKHALPGRDYFDIETQQFIQTPQTAEAAV